jgi:Flp pilus assembly protein TadB
MLSVLMAAVSALIAPTLVWWSRLAENLKRFEEAFSYSENCYHARNILLTKAE